MPVDVKDCWLEKVWIGPFLSGLHGKDVKTLMCFLQKHIRDVSSDLTRDFSIFVRFALCPPRVTSLPRYRLGSRQNIRHFNLLEQ